MILEQDFPPDLRVENEINSLSEAGHVIHLACITRTGKIEFEGKGNFYIHRRHLPVFIYKSSVAALKLPFYFRFWRKFIQDICNKYEFDAIHIHDLPLAKIGLEYKRKKNIHVTFDFHENWPDYLKNAEHTNTILGKLLSSDKQWRKYELDSCKKADSIIVVVEEAKKRLVRNGIKSEKIRVVSNTLNLNTFSDVPGNTVPEKFILFYAGGVDVQRGLQTVIEAVSILKPGNFEFWIFGKGRYSDTLKEQISKLGIRDKVKLKGHVPYKEIPGYLSQSNAAVIPHIKNDYTDTTVAHKLFQYMYIQIPILSSNCKPLERIINETQTGIIFKSENAADCAKALEKLINKSFVFVEKGKDWVLNKYNWKKDSQELIKIYS